MRPRQLRSSTIPEPQGRRGTFICGFWGIGGSECRRRADLWPLNPEGDLIFWPMIETRRGVENVDAIAQVPGVAGFYLGAGSDLSSSYGAESADDPDAKREEIEARLQSISSPFRNAHAFGVEDIIDPRDTRPLLVDFLTDAQRVIATQLGPVSGSSYRP